ncbi:phosphoenolpyruvate--protein phosphotransferase [Thiohalocapsa marina]|uniref:Phosphoenolpyruvate-protein phosphotransferase n=1 Tax=Thiohalocapsa marina TaxID=424902 RepID=A0A5M8FSU8_9GAMM|nr:phosphoenolpyruvate--protein phosphotransferase [Thiohalocapsa marina]KAA6186032.1 phosphoenolpyruvate--protein phosphotransferase [Thiohalocapsa marina]
MTTAFHGIGIGGDHPIAIGAAYVLACDPVLAAETIARDQIDAELGRLDQALGRTRRHLEQVRAQIPDATPLHIAEVIDAHLLMLTDSALIESVRALIREQKINAAWALQLQRDALVEVFERMDDVYLRARRDDIDHVVRQLQVFLAGRPPAEGLASADLSGRILVAEDLGPADLILLGRRGVAAFVTEHGGVMSHTAILARSLGIPAVLGLRNATRYLRHGEELLLNAELGSVLTGADDAIRAHYARRLAVADARRHALQQLADKPSVTRDGVPVILLANLELPGDVTASRRQGAVGVGLFRTEFLYMNRDQPPDEEAHLAAYLELVRGLDGIPLTIRTLDLGADKPLPCLGDALPRHANPALGLRAIRLCLQEPSLFVPQLRAILRASADGPVRLMLPMITSLTEVDKVLQLIAETRRALRRDGLAFDPLMPVGGMIEVPAAALIAGALARRLDFLSIGTNDLIQYTLAIDRGDDAVGHLYEPLHPAVLRLIRYTAEAGARARTQVGMCGEMAGDPDCTPLLLGLGLRELSMQPGALLAVKERVRSCDIAALTPSVDALMDRLDELEPPALADALESLAG